MRHWVEQMVCAGRETQKKKQKMFVEKMKIRKFVFMKPLPSTICDFVLRIYELQASDEWQPPESSSSNRGREREEECEVK